MTSRAYSLALAGLVLAFLTAPGKAQMDPQSGETISVALDLATLMRVPAETATVIIGNPAIADATIQRGGLVVVTGKSYGTTNLLAIDDRGGTLRDVLIRVRGEREQTVTVHRGVARETWTCAPRCEQTVTLGDAPEFFTPLSTQVGGRNGLAEGSGAPPAPPQ
jgi:Flp pilus assembly secretin CpaC